MELKIALAGNPNCGKTTLFNLLTRVFDIKEGIEEHKGEIDDLISRNLKKNWSYLS